MSKRNYLGPRYEYYPPWEHYPPPSKMPEWIQSDPIDDLLDFRERVDELAKKHNDTFETIEDGFERRLKELERKVDILADKLGCFTVEAP